MCSIFGYINLSDNSEILADQANTIEDFISGSLDLMRKRGPDSEKYIFLENNKICMGHQRLSIIDNTSFSNQPIENQNNILSFNGEIYNYIELIENYKLKTESISDTQALAAIISKQGLDSLNKLNGMFAIALYQKETKKLFLIRDRFGVKPLYYTIHNKMLYYSSNIGPLVKIRKLNKINDYAVDNFMTHSASDFDKNTFYEKIYAVENGHYLSVDDNGLVLHEKWYSGNDYKFDHNIFNDFDATQDFLENLLTDAIKIRLRTDIPACLTLSGGIDSSLIYVLCKERLGINLELFTYKHKQNESLDFKYANNLTNKYNEKLNIISDPHLKIEKKNILTDIEVPFYSPNYFSYIKTYKIISQNGHRVVLEGHGGDELFCGYKEMIYGALISSLKKLHILNFFRLLKTINENTNTFLFKKENRLIILGRVIKHFLKNFINLKDMKKTQSYYFNFRTLPVLLRVFDRTSMQSSVESRSPFMDYRVVEFSQKMPYHMKVSKDGTKHILRKILLKYGQDQIAKEKQKSGFSINLVSFLIENSFEIQKILNDSNCTTYSDEKQNFLKLLQTKSFSKVDINRLWKITSLSILNDMINQSNPSR